MNDITTFDSVIEQWRDIPGFDELYQVSDLGRIKSFHKPTPTIRRAHKITDGYFQIDLYRNRELIRWLVHRLVMFVFVGEASDGVQVNHKNGIKADNRLENLEYCTNAENSEHARKNGLWVYKLESHTSKLSREQVAEIRVALREGVQGVKLSKLYGVSQAQISRIKLGLGWRDKPPA